jgi:hypothetical protein
MRSSLGSTYRLGPILEKFIDHKYNQKAIGGTVVVYENDKTIIHANIFHGIPQKKERIVRANKIAVMFHDRKPNNKYKVKLFYGKTLSQIITL